MFGDCLNSGASPPAIPRCFDGKLVVLSRSWRAGTSAPLPMNPELLDDLPRCTEYLSEKISNSFLELQRLLFPLLVQGEGQGEVWRTGHPIALTW
jgi:hypothetical protein